MVYRKQHRKLHAYSNDSGQFVLLIISKTVFLTTAQQPPVGHGLLIVEDSQLHSDASHSVGILWTSDQPDAETST